MLGSGRVNNLSNKYVFCCSSELSQGVAFGKVFTIIIESAFSNLIEVNNLLEFPTYTLGIGMLSWILDCVGC